MVCLPSRMILRKFRGGDEGRFKGREAREKLDLIAVEDSEAAAGFVDSAADSADSDRAAVQTDSVPPVDRWAVQSAVPRDLFPSACQADPCQTYLLTGPR